MIVTCLPQGSVVTMITATTTNYYQSLPTIALLFSVHLKLRYYLHSVGNKEPSKRRLHAYMNQCMHVNGPH